MITKFGEIYLPAVTKGEWEGKLYQFGLKEGAIEMGPSHGNFATEQEAKICHIIADIQLFEYPLDLKKLEVKIEGNA